MNAGRLVSVMGVLFAGSIACASIADFEDLTLAPESYWNGSDGSGGFVSGGASFNNYYNPDYFSWAGFAYSNITDTTSKGWTAQYNSITGGGQDGSKNYAIGYMDTWNAVNPTITLNSPQIINAVYVTNNNYAYYSMLEGDEFAKKFGGTTGNDPDWFLLMITGKNAAGSVIGSVDFYLADYRFSDNGLDYIIKDWACVDLSPLGVVKSVEFTVSSSDTGPWGMNTPSYFALDTIVPEPGSSVLFGMGFFLLRAKRKLFG